MSLEDFDKSKHDIMNLLVNTINQESKQIKILEDENQSRDIINEHYVKLVEFTRNLTLFLEWSKNLNYIFEYYK